MRLSRRALLQAMAATTVLPACSSIRLGQLTPTDLDKVELLEAWFGEEPNDGIRTLGQGYMSERDLDDLDQLFDGLSTATVDEAVDTLLTRVQTELDDGGVVLANGWILAETEARLCALAWVAA